MTKTQAKKFLGKVVEICWGDAHSVDPWTPVESDDLIMEPLPCRTYGIVIGVNDRGIMCSGSINGSTDVGASWYIPLGMVDAVTILKEKD